jgi:hypothetical protein
MRTFTTFQPDLIEPNNITKASCFNGMCRIRNYRVTVEEIEEPKEVLEKRLRELWLDKNNGHSSNRKAINAEATKLGIDL